MSFSSLLGLCELDKEMLVYKEVLHVVYCSSFGFGIERMKLEATLLNNMKDYQLGTRRVQPITM
jgi:hypothetical protein